MASPKGKNPRLMPRRNKVIPIITIIDPTIKRGISDFDIKDKKKRTTIDTGLTD
jgi:hypothetical protein